MSQGEGGSLSPRARATSDSSESYWAEVFDGGLYLIYGDPIGDMKTNTPLFSYPLSSCQVSQMETRGQGNSLMQFLKGSLQGTN